MNKTLATSLQRFPGFRIWPVHQSGIPRKTGEGCKSLPPAHPQEKEDLEEQTIELHPLKGNGQQVLGSHRLQGIPLRMNGV